MQVNRLHFESIISTNQWAKDNAAKCARNQLHVITADMQTAGRGRNGRKWISPAGTNLYATFLFFVDNDQPYLGNISQLMALITAKAIEQFGIFPKLKWPNDLLLNRKKVAGILTEVYKQSKDIAVAIGIGININMDQNALNFIDKPATSLSMEWGNNLNIEKVLGAIIDKFTSDLPLFLQKSLSPFLSAYREKLIHAPKEEIYFQLENRAIVGKFLQIANDGTLQLELDNGEIKVFSSGEIYLKA